MGREISGYELDEKVFEKMIKMIKEKDIYDWHNMLFCDIKKKLREEIKKQYEEEVLIMCKKMRRNPRNTDCPFDNNIYCNTDCEWYDEKNDQCLFRTLVSVFIERINMMDKGGE